MVVEKYTEGGGGGGGGGGGAGVSENDGIIVYQRKEALV